MTNKKTIKRTTTNLLIYDNNEQKYNIIYKDIENGTRWLMEKDGETYYCYLSYIRDFDYIDIIKQDTEANYIEYLNYIKDFEKIMNEYNSCKFNDEKMEDWQKKHDLINIFEEKYKKTKEQNERIKELNYKYIELIKELKEL